VPHAPQINEHESSQCHISVQRISGPAVNTLTATGIAHIYSGLGVREWCRHPGQHSPRGRKWVVKLIFYINKFDFFAQRISNLEPNNRNGNTLL
jgi:hypothetical protein